MKTMTPSLKKLEDCAVDILSTSAQEARSLGFSTRVLVQASLPHSEPTNNPRAWIRRNGNYSLIIQPGVDSSGESLGFPHGNIPRLVLAYLTTSVVRTKSREIDLGTSLSAFMREIGLYSNGRDIRRVKEQLARLFSASITFRFDDEKARLIGGAHRPIAREFQFWWDDRHPEQQTLFPNFVRLDEEFHREILEHPVPMDLRAIQALKQSSLALDIYTWLNHRMSYLDKQVRIPWKSIEQHIGSDYKSTREFSRWSREALIKIKAIWPELQVDFVHGGLLLKPSRPHVQRVSHQVLLPPR
jgi:hypothetical protein